MSSPVDQLASRLVHEVVDLAPTPPPWSDVLARTTMETSTARRRSRRHPLVAIAAAGGVIAAALVGLVVYERSRGSSDGGVVGVGTATTTAPTLSTTGPPVAPTDAQASRPLAGDSSASCAFEYSPETLAQRGFAFDGVVTAIAADPSGIPPSERVTFRVEEWFVGGDAPEVTATLVAPNRTSLVAPEYDIGTRLLISGGDAGVPSIEPLLAWTCGFSRTYDVPTAALWRQVFGAEAAPDPTSTEQPVTTATDGGPPGNGNPAPGVFAPSAVPDGFSVVEASTWDGPRPGTLPQVSVEAWIARDTNGDIADIVRLLASEQPIASRGVPVPEPGDATVHGAPAQPMTMNGMGSSIAWEENGLTLLVTSWGPDAAAIAERSIVTSSGLALPAGALPDSFVRVDSGMRPSLAEGRSSTLTFATSDGATTVSLSAAPNSNGVTVDSLGATPGSQRRTVGDRQVWLVTPAAGPQSALWIDGDHVVSATGSVDEATLLTFASSVKEVSTVEFDAYVVQASTADYGLVERDHAVFADGLSVSMHSGADIDVPSAGPSSPHAFCVVGDRTLCKRATPQMEYGLPTTIASTRTINGEREIVLWSRAGRSVARVFDTDTGADVAYESAGGNVGSFVRAQLPPEATSLTVEYRIDGAAGLDRRGVELAPLDPLSNVDISGQPAG